jgi:hypothetical protein
MQLVTGQSISSADTGLETGVEVGFLETPTLLALYQLHIEICNLAYDVIRKNGSGMCFTQSVGSKIATHRVVPTGIALRVGGPLIYSMKTVFMAHPTTRIFEAWSLLTPMESESCRCCSVVGRCKSCDGAKTVFDQDCSYTEVVNVLYAENTFSINSYHPRWEDQPAFLLSDLSKLLLAMNFNTITALDVRLDVQAHKDLNKEQVGLWASMPCFNAQEFDDCWAAMASMPRLRRLYVKLDMFVLPPLTGAVFNAILEPIDRMRGKRPLEFHLAAPEPTFRIFRKHLDPPYTSISFWSVATSEALDIGVNGEEWDDGSFKKFNDDEKWFPIYDCKSYCSRYKSIMHQLLICGMT